MRLTGLIWSCTTCCKDFEVFSDDGANDRSVCWNWCPHCGARNEIWKRVKYPNESILSGIGCEEAAKRFPKREASKGQDLLNEHSIITIKNLYGFKAPDYEYVKAFEKNNIPKTFLGEQIDWYIRTCTPIDDNLVSTIKSDLRLEVIDGITKTERGAENPDLLIQMTRAYIENKNALKTLSNSRNNYLSLTDAVEEEQLKEQLENITEEQRQDFHIATLKINIIAEYILIEILNKYLPPLPTEA